MMNNGTNLVGQLFDYDAAIEAADIQCIQESKDANALLKAACEAQRASHEAFWETVYQVYPELKDYVVRADREKKVLIVVRKENNAP